MLRKTAVLALLLLTGGWRANAALPACGARVDGEPLHRYALILAQPDSLSQQLPQRSQFANPVQWRAALGEHFAKGWAMPLEEARAACAALGAEVEHGGPLGVLFVRAPEALLPALRGLSGVQEVLDAKEGLPRPGEKPSSLASGVGDDGEIYTIP